MCSSYIIIALSLSPPEIFFARSSRVRRDITARGKDGKEVYVELDFETSSLLRRLLLGSWIERPARVVRQRQRISELEQQSRCFSRGQLQRQSSVVQQGAVATGEVLAEGHRQPRPDVVEKSEGDCQRHSPLSNCVSSLFSSFDFFSFTPPPLLPASPCRTLKPAIPALPSSSPRSSS